MYGVQLDYPSPQGKDRDVKDSVRLSSPALSRPSGGRVSSGTANQRDGERILGLREVVKADPYVARGDDAPGGGGELREALGRFGPASGNARLLNA
jgi:hypothetical protein